MCDDEEIRGRATEWLMNISDALQRGLASETDVAQLRAVCSRVIDRVLVHPPDWEPPDGVLDGDFFIPASGGGCVLEIVWHDPDHDYQPPVWRFEPTGGGSGGPYVQRPPSIVATTCTSRSSSGSQANGSRSSTTRSA